MRLHAVLRSWLAAGILAAAPLASTAAAAPDAPATGTTIAAVAAGTECGCLETGPYQDPKPLVTPKVFNVNGTEGDSAASNPKYHLNASPSGPDNALTVTRLADGHVFTLSTHDTQWGFSPDQDRILTHGISGGQLSWSVFDLAGASPAVAHPLASMPMSNARLGFSPGGDYVMLTALSGTNDVTQYVADARTGAKAFQDSYSFAIAPTGDEFGGAGYGFSPDGDELVYAFVTGPDSVTVRLASLRTSATYVKSLSVSGGYWQFSPCGSVLAVVNQVGTGPGTSNATVTAVRNTGTELSNHPTTPVGPTTTIDFKATATQHLVTINGADQVLGANTAQTSCPDTTKPTWPAGASLSATNVAKTTLRLSWSAADDDIGVTQYRVYRGTALLTTLPAATRTYDVTGLSGGTTYSFHVEAGDAADNWSIDGPSTDVTTSVGAPTWPAGSSLTASDPTNTSMTLRWTAAEDDVAVTGYRVFLDGTQVGTTTGARSLAMSGLDPSTTYAFRVEAVDGEGHVSTGGPSATLRTSGLTVLDTPSVTGMIWNDTNRDGVHDSVEGGIPSGGTPALGIYLYRVSGDVVLSQAATSSDNNGVFRFDDLPDGHYVLSLIVYPRIQTFPADYQPMQFDVVGGHGVGNVEMGAVVAHFPDLDAGTARIIGSVFADQDGDGTRGSGESGLGGVTMDCYDVEVGSGCGTGPAAVTGSDGSYQVNGVFPGTHVLTPELADGQYLTAPTDGRSRLVVTSSEQTGAVGPFGVTTGAAQLHGTVFFDHDQDGVRDTGDETLTAATLRFFDVCVRDDVKGVDRCGTLAEDGSYDVTGLPGGTYTLATGGEQWTLTTTSVTVGPTGTTTKDVGLFAHVGAIVGLVWDDRDGDGVRDPGEPGIGDSRVCWRETGLAEGVFGCTRTEADDPATPAVDEAGTYAAPYVAAKRYEVTADRVPDATQTRPAEAYVVDLADGATFTADFGFHSATAGVVPGAPTGLSAQPGNGSASLAWAAPVDDGGSAVNDYVVQSSPDGTTWTTVADPVSTATTTVVTGLTNGKAAFVRVAAVNSTGQGPWSTPVSLTPRTEPSAPRSLHAAVRSHKVTLTWGGPATTGGAPVTDYVVQRSTHATRGWVTLRDGVSTKRTATVTGLRNGTRYFFRVAAKNAAATGPWTPVVQARPHS